MIQKIQTRFEFNDFDNSSAVRFLDLLEIVKIFGWFSYDK